MIDTSIAAAYAAQYARKSGVEPIVEYYCPNIGTHYTYILLDDLSAFLSDNDSMKNAIKDYGWELHVYDEKPSRLYAVPGHTPGGTRLVNKIDYCGFIDFKDSRKATEVNIRNVAIAAKELVHRCQECQKFVDEIPEKFKTLPERSELADIVLRETGSDSWARRVAKKYGYDYSRADSGQIVRSLRVLENLGGIVPVGYPFTKVDPSVARHWIENALRMCADVNNEYLSRDSFGIAASIYMEDRYDSSVLSDGLQLPQIFETLEYFDKNS